MSIRVKEVSSNGKNHKSRMSGENNGSKVVTESYSLGEITTLPLIYLEGEMQQREFHKPGLSMRPINILEEDNPAKIKEYLCGFIDLPTSLWNAGLQRDQKQSFCIDLGGVDSKKDIILHSGKTSWYAQDVAVSSPKMVFGSRSMNKERLSQEAEDDYKTTTASHVVNGTHSALDDILDEFSVELEKKLKQNGFSAHEIVEGDSDNTTVWWLKKKPKEGTTKQCYRQQTLTEIDQKVIAEPDDEETEYYGDEIVFEDSLNAILELMEELESEKWGTEEERESFGI